MTEQRRQLICERCRACLKGAARRFMVRLIVALPVIVEAVAQTLGPMLVGGRCGGAVGDVPAVCDGVRPEGRVLGRHGGEVVAVNLGEVVGHHQ
jgi:hypothetical protein